MNLKIFKAYDIRGRYPAEINEDVAAEIIRAVGHLLGRGRVIVAHDARTSSPSLYGAVIRAVQKHTRLVPHGAGLATTPMLYFLVNHYRATGGIMITASHNPAEYNGLKIVRRRAEPVNGTEILKIVGGRKNV